MTQNELKTTFLLSGIYITRMLGLFLIFPTFSVLAQDLDNATPAKVGLALGIYSLAQAILQIPVGWLSDIIGRKKVLYAGLILFFIGSVWASLTDDLDTLIIARLLQGMGAVSAVCLAYVGDSIRGSEQGKAMMIIGMAIGSAFMLAFMLGAIISAHWGLAGLFRTTAMLALLALVFAYLLPAPPQQLTVFKLKSLTNALFNRHLLFVNGQIACLHMTLTACFFLLPMLLDEHLPNASQATLYVIPLVITAIIVSPLVRNRDRATQQLPLFWGAFAISLLVIAGFSVFSHANYFMIAITLFFCAFTLVETLLPAQLFQFTEATARGATSGIFSLYQLGGSFLGGLLGAKCYTLFATNGTIQSAFYILAIPAIVVVTANIFINKQRRKVTHG